MWGSALLSLAALAGAANISYFRSGMDNPSPCSGVDSGGEPSSNAAVWRPQGLLPWRDIATGTDQIIAPGFRARTASGGYSSDDIAISTDQGVSWTCQPSSSPAQRVRTMAARVSHVIDDCSLACVVGGAPTWTPYPDGNVSCTADGGKTWAEHTPVPMLSILTNPAAVSHNGMLLVLASNSSNMIWWQAVLDVQACTITGWTIPDKLRPSQGLGIRIDVSLMSIPDPGDPSGPSLLYMAAGAVMIDGGHSTRVWDLWRWQPFPNGVAVAGEVLHSLPTPTTWDPSIVTSNEVGTLYRLMPALLPGSAPVRNVTRFDLLWQAGSKVYMSSDGGLSWVALGLAAHAPREYLQDTPSMLNFVTPVMGPRGTPYIAAVLRPPNPQAQPRPVDGAMADWDSEGVEQLEAEAPDESNPSTTDVASHDSPGHSARSLAGPPPGTILPVTKFVRLSMVPCQAGCSTREVGPDGKYYTRSSGCTAGPRDARCIACSTCALGMREVVPCGGPDRTAQEEDATCAPMTVSLSLVSPPALRGAGLGWSAGVVSSVVGTLAAAVALASIISQTDAAKDKTRARQDGYTVSMWQQYATSATLMQVILPALASAAYCGQLVLSVALVQSTIGPEEHNSAGNVTTAPQGDQAAPFANLVASAARVPELAGSVLLLCASLQVLLAVSRWATLGGIGEVGVGAQAYGRQGKLVSHCSAAAVGVALPRAWWLSVLLQTGHRGGQGPAEAPIGRTASDHSTALLLACLDVLMDVVALMALLALVLVGSIPHATVSVINAVTALTATCMVLAVLVIWWRIDGGAALAKVIHGCMERVRPRIPMPHTAATSSSGPVQHGAAGPAGVSTAGGKLGPTKVRNPLAQASITDVALGIGYVPSIGVGPHETVSVGPIGPPARDGHEQLWGRAARAQAAGMMVMPARPSMQQQQPQAGLTTGVADWAAPRSGPGQWSRQPHPPVPVPHVPQATVPTVPEVSGSPPSGHSQASHDWELVRTVGPQDGHGVTHGPDVGFSQVVDGPRGSEYTSSGRLSNTDPFAAPSEGPGSDSEAGQGHENHGRGGHGQGQG